MKKAQVHEHLVLIIILLISFFVLLAVTYMIITRSHATSVAYTCKMSLADGARTGNPNLKCTAAIYTVNPSEIKEDDIVSIDLIKSLLAREMAACWSTVSKGEFGLQIFGTVSGAGGQSIEPDTDDDEFCLICTVVQFDEKTSSKVRQIQDFKEYLEDTEDPTLKQKYHEYMEDDDGVHYSVTEPVDITKPIAVVWKYEARSGVAVGKRSSILLKPYDRLVKATQTPGFRYPSRECDIMVN